MVQQKFISPTILEVVMKRFNVSIKTLIIF